MNEPGIAINIHLYRAISQFYGAPIDACPLRACHRAGVCRHRRKRRIPICFNEMSPEALAPVIEAACDMMMGRHSTAPARDPESRTIEEIAIEIAKLTIAHDDTPAHLFRTFLHSYRGALAFIRGEIWHATPIRIR